MGSCTKQAKLLLLQTNWEFHFLIGHTVIGAQLVRALVCGSRGRRFEPGLSPKNPSN